MDFFFFFAQVVMMFRAAVGKVVKGQETPERKDESHGPQETN